MLTNRRVFSPKTPSKQKLALLSLLLISTLNAETLDDALEGFDDEPTTKKEEVKLHPLPPIEHRDASREDIMDGFDDEPKKNTTPRSHAERGNEE